MGNVGDLGWSLSLLGDALTFPTISQILDSAKYWWEGERLFSAYMCIQCYASQDTCRGELKVAEDVTKLMAFIYVFGLSHGFTMDPEAEPSPLAKAHFLVLSLEPCFFQQIVQSKQESPLATHFSCWLVRTGTQKSCVSSSPLRCISWSPE